MNSSNSHEHDKEGANRNNTAINGKLAPSVDLLLSHQRPDGYWWYTLEANETIGAEFIFLMHYLNEVDEDEQRCIANRIFDVQRDNGTWAIYHGGPPDLSTTIECYYALKIAGTSADAEHMIKARQYILEHGGIEKSRVFTKIHLAMFGIVPWSACPEMPAWFIFMPKWFPFNIYEFSSWARSTIVPLTVFMTLKRDVAPPNGITLNELFKNPPEHRDYSFRHDKGIFSWENFFIYLDRGLKILNKLHLKKLNNYAINKCLRWTWEHVQRTEDIYPALAYCALAFKAFGYQNDSPQIQKSLSALRMFQQRYTTDILPALPEYVHDDGKNSPSKSHRRNIERSKFRKDDRIHQQSCISPVWDTPWAVLALLESGLFSGHPALQKAGSWLLSKQIINMRGDWAVKNRSASPGGWAFEFENEHFPDVDDTIEVLTVINKLLLPEETRKNAIVKGNSWLLSMQNDDGGWGAFDKNQNQILVNRIPFADHKACLDPSTPDITGRMLEYLATQGYSKDDSAIKRAIAFIWSKQESFGGWYGRWGVNYIYGTWNVLMGMAAIGAEMSDSRLTKAADWLESIQRDDGGWSESPLTYDMKKFSSYGVSIPSQSAWALMGLVAAGRSDSKSAKRGAHFLLNSRNADGGWDEEHYTGTGFEGHFYIRYHGYRYFFPLLALARYFNAIKTRRSDIV